MECNEIVGQANTPIEASFDPTVFVFSSYLSMFLTFGPNINPKWSWEAYQNLHMWRSQKRWQEKIQPSALAKSLAPMNLGGQSIRIQTEWIGPRRQDSM